MQTAFFNDSVIRCLKPHLIGLNGVAEVLVPLGQRLHLVVIILKHEELAITHFADSACDRFSVFKFDRIRKLPSSQSAVRARLHGTELATDHLLDGLLTGEAMHRVLLEYVEGLRVDHLQLEYLVIWIECVYDTKDCDLFGFSK